MAQLPSIFLTVEGAQAIGLAHYLKVKVIIEFYKLLI